ncbi:MAG: hypothetical protein R6V85_20490 [Polyangia bacterium]
MDIQLYDLSDSSSKMLTDEYQQALPRINGSRVVYMDLRHSAYGLDGPWDHAAVFLYDLETDQETQLTNAEWIANNPDVFGDVVIWTDYRFCADPNNKNSFTDVELFGTNLETEQTAQITDLPGHGKAFPRIWGERVYVQMYYGPGQWGIFAFDLPDELKTP